MRGNAGDTGQAAAVMVEVSAELAAYDRLPPSLRALVRELPMDVNGIDVLRAYLQMGEANLARELGRYHAMLVEEHRAIVARAVAG